MEFFGFLFIMLCNVGVCTITYGMLYIYHCACVECVVNIHHHDVHTMRVFYCILFIVALKTPNLIIIEPRSIFGYKNHSKLDGLYKNHSKIGWYLLFYVLRVIALWVNYFIHHGDSLQWVKNKFFVLRILKFSEWIKKKMLNGSDEEKNYTN